MNLETIKFEDLWRSSLKQNPKLSAATTKLNSLPTKADPVNTDRIQLSPEVSLPSPAYLVKLHELVGRAESSKTTSAADERRALVEIIDAVPTIVHSCLDTIASTTDLNMYTGKDFGQEVVLTEGNSPKTVFMRRQTKGDEVIDSIATTDGTNIECSRTADNETTIVKKQNTGIKYERTGHESTVSLAS